MGEPLIQVLGIYLIFVGVVTALFWAKRKVLKNKILIFLYALVLISPFTLYIPIEINTYLYGKEFKHVKIDTGFSGSVIYYKVFSIDDNEAKLFYVEGKDGQHDVGNFYNFIKENGMWKFKSWGRTMWTNLGGSASEFTIPPYF